MSIYDVIIAGGGAAGLSLAYEMSLSGLRGQQILIVDRETKTRHDRSWCYWSDAPTHFDHLAYRRWERVEILTYSFQDKYDIHPYTYYMMRGIDFYKGLHETLSKVPGIDFRQARAGNVTEADDHSMASVMIDNIPVGAHWVFDSTFNPAEINKGRGWFTSLKRQFKGWEIETPVDCFDPNTATLFDFRTPQKGCLRFFSVHPFTRRRALVEYTLFSAHLPKGTEVDRAIANYLENVRGISRYRTDNTESGATPMTDRPFPRKLGPHAMAIGVKGGLVKPTLGTAFLRVQKDAAAVVSSLINYGNPFQVPRTALHSRMVDSLLLRIMQRDGNHAADVFAHMFQKNAVQDILRFFDEKASLLESVRLLASLPCARLARAFYPLTFPRLQ